MKSYDDINNENNKQKNDEIRQDLNQIMNAVMTDFDDMIKRRKIEREIKEQKRKKNVFDYFYYIFGFIGIVSVCLFILNFLLANVWLLRYFVNYFTGY